LAEIITLDEPFEVPSDAQLLQNLVAAANERTHHVVRYDSAYVGIPYLNGDVPAGTGSAPMKLSVPVAPSASICKKKSTKTWSTTFRRIREGGNGRNLARTPTLTTVAYPT